jgi:hypothetical protein
MNNKSYYYIMGEACVCPVGYSQDINGICSKVEEVPPTITSSDYCLAPSRRNEYSGVKTRVYNPGFSFSSIKLDPAPSGDILVEFNTANQWRALNSSTGPMNRAGVWVDTNCDGVKDALGGSMNTVFIDSAGSGLVDGVYNFVQYTTTTGEGAYGTVTISGGSVTSATVVNGGSQYTTGQAITINPSQIGGTLGTGLSLSVFSLSSYSFKGYK